MRPVRGVLLKKLLKKKGNICLESKKNLFLFVFLRVVQLNGFKIILQT